MHTATCLMPSLLALSHFALALPAPVARHAAVLDRRDGYNSTLADRQMAELQADTIGSVGVGKRQASNTVVSGAVVKRQAFATGIIGARQVQPSASDIVSAAPPLDVPQWSFSVAPTPLPSVALSPPSQSDTPAPLQSSFAPLPTVYSSVEPISSSSQVSAPPMISTSPCDSTFDCLTSDPILKRQDSIWGNPNPQSAQIYDSAAPIPTLLSQAVPSPEYSEAPVAVKPPASTSQAPILTVQASPPPVSSQAPIPTVQTPPPLLSGQAPVNSFPTLIPGTN